ncbi:MAG: hypothetical protein LIO71_08325 [Ruminococcus sp.]|nr:hypothetical protein [Ruminococcus sp.]
MNHRFKKILKVTYVIVFFVMCLVPIVCIPIVGNSVDSTSENRTLSQMPKLINDDGSINTSVGVEFETYLSEHFAFRNQLVQLNNQAYYSIFGQSAEDDVIVGKDGWLYYSKTIDDYLSRNVLSELEINNIVTTLRLEQEYVENYGGKFLFTVIPNKNTLYDEYMPYNYIKSNTPNNLDMLTEALNNSEISFCDMKEILSSDDSILYHKTDTHWNNHGALIGYNAMLDSLNIAHNDFSTVSYYSEKSWDGDLAKMLFPNYWKKDVQIQYDIDYNYTYTSVLLKEDFDDNIITTSNTNGTDSLLMFRDSFGRALIPFMSEQFNTVTFSRANPITLLDASQDVVIFEIVERNIDTILSSAPTMIAPERNNVSITDTYIDNDNVFQYKFIRNKEYLQMYGQVNISNLSGNNINVYALIETDNSSTVFEAFPIYESNLLKYEDSSGNIVNDICIDGYIGYSLIVPSSILNSSENRVSILVTDGVSTISSGTLGNVQFD